MPEMWKAARFADRGRKTKIADDIVEALGNPQFADVQPAGR